VIGASPSPLTSSARRSIAVILCGILFAVPACARNGTATGMSDAALWSLITAVSEPAGTFNLSDNLVSNEPHLAENVRRLRPAGGVYIGVGPEQNFSYIAQLRPALAFIVDIRRENRSLHLLYKALFEMSADRADFVARLFSRPRPGGLGSASTVDEIFRKFDGTAPSPEQFTWNERLLRDRLLVTHRLPLEQIDLDWIARVFRAFYTDGPSIRYWRSPDVDAVQPSYRELMTAADAIGLARSFLATEDAFQFVKDLHARNLIVPVVGDFGGPRSIQAVGDYAREHGHVIRAFYGSNVGVYLTREKTRAFCRNLASLPAASDTWFIERDGVRTLSSKLKACAPAP
jgi:hypothetical protein